MLLPRRRAEWTALNARIGTIGIVWAPAPEILDRHLSLRFGGWGVIFIVRAGVEEDELGSDHEEGLENEGSFEVLEGVEVESEDVGDEEDEADVDWEAPDRLVFADEAVLKDVAGDWADCHGLLEGDLPTSSRNYIWRTIYNFINVRNSQTE